MSRIGKLPISIPTNTTVQIVDSLVTISGPKGNQELRLLPGISASLDTTTNQLVVRRANDLASNRANHGLMRSLLANIVTGVSVGFSKQLELIGVGYRVNQVDKGLVFNLGFSHEIKFSIPSDLSASINDNIITISGIDKQRVGQIAAEIRQLKKPEPYKGKGLRYVGEYIIRKSGKSGKDK